jgi:hypothetical protein
VGALGFGSWFFHILRCRHWARTGNYSIVEGVIKQFHPMPYEGHDWERITVGGTEFMYADFDVPGGFNNTQSHGGPLHEGLNVRIAYHDGKILRLWIAEKEP